MTPEELLTKKTPEELFGKKKSFEDLKLAYRLRAREVHPDNHNNSQVATDAFAHLNNLFQTAQKSITAGTYGTNKAPLVDVVTIQSRRHVYKIRDPLSSDSVSNLFTGRDEMGQSVVLKVAKRGTNDLLQNEAQVLKRLLSNIDTYDQLAPYVPAYVETFGFKQGGKGQPKQATVFSGIDQNPALTYVEGLEYYTLEQVKERYSAIPPKHMAWIFRRLLIVLGIAHGIGLVHGSVFPENVLIQPEQHGLVLTNWYHSVPMNEVIKTADQQYMNWLPAEVRDKQKTIPGTDLYMAAQTMFYILGGDPRFRGGSLSEAVPKEIRAFLMGTATNYRASRPTSAFDLKDEFTEMIERLWGPRRFIPFSM